MRNILIYARGRAVALWLLPMLALVVRLIVASLTTGADYDIISYHIQAQSVLTHHNIYAFTDRYPYPPVWVWLVRLPGIMGDVLIVTLLQRYKSNKAALFYAMNPVSILITAGHGQFDGLVMSLVVVAWVLWKKRYRGNAAWAALALGGAIALKGYPILLLPALLIGAPSNKQRVTCIGLALTPLLICMVVYTAVFGLEPMMISHVLGYQSPPLFGWSLYVNNLLPLLWPHSVILLLVLLFLWIATRFALLLFPILLAIRKLTWRLEYLWLVTLLSFYILAPGLSPQYLLWILPLLALVDLKKGFLYSSFSLAALLFFYLAYSPGAVPWGTALGQAMPPYIWLLGYWAANLVWWLSCAWLLLATFQLSGKVSALSHARNANKAQEVVVFLYGGCSQGEGT